jgi:hypothetical protein
MKKIIYTLQIYFTLLLLSGITLQNIYSQIYFQNQGSIHVSSNANLYIQGNMIHGAGAIKNTGNIYVTGDVNNTSAGLVFDSTASGKVYLAGGAQTITGNPIAFHLLILSGNGIKNFNSSTIIRDSLALINAELKLNNNSLSFLNTSSAGISRGTGFISTGLTGFISRKASVSADYLFPMGSSNASIGYVPVRIKPSLNQNNTYRVTLAADNPTTQGYSTSSLANGLCSVSGNYFYKISQTFGSTPTSVALGFTAPASFDAFAQWQNTLQWVKPANAVTETVNSINWVKSPLVASFTPNIFAAGLTGAVIAFQVPSTICNNASAITLAATPSGGNFSGPGVSAGTFNPATVGPGQYWIKYAVTSANCSQLDSTLIQVTNTPVATITPSGPTTLCSGDNVTLQASTGSSYLWSTGATAPSINVTQAGNYVVTVTNATSCTATSTTVSVIVNPIPVASITPSGPTTFCTGNNVTLQASSGASYLWSTGSTSASINVTQAGNYVVTVTNANNCSATSTATSITVNALPVATISASGPTTFCAGNNVILSASTGSSYLWNTGETTPSIAVSQGGNYSVTITNANSCSSSSSITAVTLLPLPVATITPSGPTTFCSGNNITLQASTGSSYLWSTGSTSSSITVNQSGNYSVTITNANNCSSSSNVTAITVNPLPVATITPSGPTTFCNGDNVNLLASAGSSFLWSTGATTQSINVSQAGNYTVSITNGNNCSSVSTITTVSVNPLPVATITPTGPTTFCNGGNVTLQASTGSSYLWSTGATTASINVTQAGNYTVSITNGNNCSSVSTITTVSVNPLPVATITPTGPTTFCDGNNVTLQASTGASYLWSTGATTQNINVTQAGNYVVTVTNGNNCSSTSIATNISINPLPSVSISPNGPTAFCDGGNVTLTASSGSSYLWSTGATTPSINVTQSGNYTVIVTNANNCTSSSQATSITVNALPSASITPSGPTTFCAGNNVTLQAPVGNTYLWNTGGTVQSLTVSQSGTYTVTVTNANNCTAVSLPMNITVNALPTSTITPLSNTTFCSGGSVTLQAPAGYSYLWNTGGNVQNLTVNQSGSYTVTVTDANNCSSVSTAMNVTVNTLPSSIITASGPTSFCNGNDVTLTASAGTSYLWSNGSTSPSITVNQTGGYVVTVTDNNGCSSASAVTSVNASALPNADVNVSGPLVFCQGGNVILTAATPGLDYLWSNGSQTQSINITQAGFFTVTVTDNNGCSAVSSLISVTVLPNPVVTINTSGPTTFCDGNNVVLSATPAANYLWSNGSTNSTLTAFQSGNYQVTVTDAQGCTTSSSIITVIVNPSPTATISATGPTTFCQGDDVTLNGGGGLTYLWSNSATTPSIVVNQTGSYNVTVTNEFNCSSVSSAIDVVVQTAPDIVWTVNDTLCKGDTLVLGASPLGGTFSGTGVFGNTFFSSSAPLGLNVITYNYFDGVCDATSTLNLNVVDCSSSIETTDGDISINIYPNPFEETIYIDCPGECNIQTVRLMNMSGQIISMTSSQQNNRWQINIDRELAAGTYMLQVMMSDGKMITRPLISALKR